MFGEEINTQRISVLSARDALCNEHEKVTLLENWTSSLQRMWVGHCFKYRLFMANVPMCDKPGKYSWNPCLTTKPNKAKHTTNQELRNYFFESWYFNWCKIHGIKASICRKLRMNINHQIQNYGSPPCTQMSQLYLSMMSNEVKYGTSSTTWTAHSTRTLR